MIFLFLLNFIHLFTHSLLNSAFTQLMCSFLHCIAYCQSNKNVTNPINIKFFKQIKNMYHLYAGSSLKVLMGLKLRGKTPLLLLLFFSSRVRVTF